MGDFIAHLFGQFDRQWLFRAYFIGFLFLCLCSLMTLGLVANPSIEQGERGTSTAVILVLSILNTLLFPFAKLVWNNLKGFVLGDTILLSNFLFLIVGKFVVNFTLWWLALVIAPFGVGYLWFKGRA